MISDISSILNAFNIDDKDYSLKEITVGNINDTYRIDSGRSYILQSVNTHVFSSPYAMMENIDKVTSHIREKVRMEGGDDKKATLHFHRTRDNSLLYEERGKYYRLSDYIENSFTNNEDASPSLLRKAGLCFGRFEALLSDFDSSLLSETIPDFHNTKKRISDFEKIVEEDKAGRARETEKDILSFLRYKDEASVMCSLIEKKEIPLRVTHNDTKLNNILFDKTTLEPLLVIDLDTVMPGLLAYDAADTIRYSASSAKEDEKDTEKIFLVEEKYEAFLSGFLSVMSPFMTKTEKETLVTGILTIVYEQGLRFLSDYLEGDVYYKTTRPGQNLDRARSQFALFMDMRKKRRMMEERAAEYYS